MDRHLLEESIGAGDRDLFGIDRDLDGGPR